MSHRRVVLVVSDPNDLHANIVLQRLGQLGTAEGVLLDCADFPTSAALCLEVRGDRAGSVLRLPDWSQPVGASEVVGVWWRRPRQHTTRFDLDDPDVQAYCERNAQSLFESWIVTCPGRVVNDPYAQARADRKPVQLHMARRAGLRVPATLVTNDPFLVTRFVADHAGRVVCKSLAGTDRHYSFTSLWDEVDRERLETLRLAPAIFQEYIEGIDLRITVVGNELFPAKVVPAHKGAEVDWRLDAKQNIAAVQVPQQVGDGLLRLMAMLHLDYAAIDMRLDRDGRYWFLEANTSGQFLFIECQTNQMISMTLARLLSRPTD